MLTQAHSLGLHSNLPFFLKNLLSGRHFRVRVSDMLSLDFVQAEGVPQGVCPEHHTFSSLQIMWYTFFHLIFDHHYMLMTLL